MAGQAEQAARTDLSLLRSWLVRHPIATVLVLVYGTTRPAGAHPPAASAPRGLDHPKAPTSTTEQGPGARCPRSISDRAARASSSNRFRPRSDHRGDLGALRRGLRHLGQHWSITPSRPRTASGYTRPLTFESFSSAVGSPTLSNDLAIWRNMWDDGPILAAHACTYLHNALTVHVRH
jgi:hypothetical protein